MKCQHCGKDIDTGSPQTKTIMAEIDPKAMEENEEEEDAAYSEKVVIAKPTKTKPQLGDIAAAYFTRELAKAK